MYVEGIASGGGSDWFYIAVIHAPNGADVHVDDGDEDIDATVASGDYIGIPVHNQNSTYTITVTMNGLAAPDQTFTTGSTSGQMIEKTFEFAEIDITYDDEFRGQTLTITDGTHTPSPAQVVPSTGNNLVLRVPYTGNWHISAVDPVSGDTFYTSPDPIAITSLSQTVSCHLFVIPDGKTVTPTDDIQTWLACANIKGKSYTTLAEVLADEDTLRKLLTDDNAIDYLKRSTTWAVATGLVPTKSADDASILYSSYTVGLNPYKGFDDDWTKTPTQYSENNRWGANGASGQYLGYDFGSPIKVSKVKIVGTITGSDYSVNEYRIEYSDDNITWNPATGDLNGEPDQIFDVFINPSIGSHRYWRLYIISTTSAGGINAGVHNLQFYSDADIQSSQLAMSYIGAYDYAADTLLGDSTWNAAILGSTYAGYVLNVSVPTMTDDTHPSGECFGSAAYSTNWHWYNAFAPNTAGFLGTNSATGQYIGYDFKKLVKLCAIKFKNGEMYNWSAFANYDVEYSDDITDPTSWSKIGTYATGSTTVGTIVSQSINMSGKAKAFRILNNSTGFGISDIEMLCREAAGVQTWLKAAGLDRPYTTLAEVLADHDALAALMSSHDAVDYLVTVKSWIDAITADETAMRYIGRRNYAADTLLADSDWGQGIAKSDYASYVFNVFVPTMTDDTHPSGEASATKDSANAWKAFDGDPSTSWNNRYVSQTVASEYLRYDFGTAKKVNCVYFLGQNSSSVYYTAHDFKVFGTNNPAGTWDELATFQVGGITGKQERVVNFNNNNSYRYYELRPTGTSNERYWYQFELQFYGREDVDETTIDIFSAASDTVYYLDSSNNPVTVATTDTSGKATIQKSLLPNGTYTLYSTIAKDPDNLSNPYSKQVTITDETMDVMVMPDGALYWYGWNGNFEIGTDANGWTNLSGDNPANYVDMNTRDISYTWETGTSCGGLGTKNKVSDAEKLRSIVNNGSGAANKSMYLMVNTAKSLVGSLGAQFKRFDNLASSDAIISYDLPDGYKSDVYLGCGKAASGYSLNGVLTKALWYE